MADYKYTDEKQRKAGEHDTITLKKSCTAVIHNMITRDLECPWHLLCNLLLDDVTGADFENSLYASG